MIRMKQLAGLPLPVETNNVPVGWDIALIDSEESVLAGIGRYWFAVGDLLRHMDITRSGFLVGLHDGIFPLYPRSAASVPLYISVQPEVQRVVAAFQQGNDLKVVTLYAGRKEDPAQVFDYLADLNNGHLLFVAIAVASLNDVKELIGLRKIKALDPKADFTLWRFSQGVMSACSFFSDILFTDPTALPASRAVPPAVAAFSVGGRASALSTGMVIRNRPKAQRSVRGNTSTSAEPDQDAYFDRIFRELEEPEVNPGIIQLDKLPRRELPGTIEVDKKLTLSIGHPTLELATEVKTLRTIQAWIEALGDVIATTILEKNVKEGFNTYKTKRLSLTKEGTPRHKLQLGQQKVVAIAKLNNGEVWAYILTSDRSAQQTALEFLTKRLDQKFLLIAVAVPNHLTRPDLPSLIKLSSPTCVVFYVSEKAISAQYLKEA